MIVATPCAKKLAKQHKVDINKTMGIGPFGWIMTEDIEKAARIAPSKTNVAANVAPASAIAAAPSPSSPKPISPASFPQIPGSIVVPFTTMQVSVSKNMLESRSVPTFCVGYPVTTDALDALYEKGAVMVVGALKPIVAVDAYGFFSVKSKMLI